MDYDTTSLGAGVSRGLDDFAAIQDKHKQEAKLFDSLVNVAAASGMMTKEEAKVMSLPQLSGTLEGLTVKRKLARDAQEAQLRQAQIDRFTRQGQADDALEGFGRDFSNGPSAMELPSAGGQPPTLTDFTQFGINTPASVGGGIEPHDLLALETPEARARFALKRNPRAAVNPQFDNTLGTLARIHEKPLPDLPANFEPSMITRGGVTYKRRTDGATGVTFYEDPVSGQRFAQAGKSVLPSGSNPEKKGEGADKLIELTDEEGNPTGVKGYYRNTKNGRDFVPVKTTKTFGPDSLVPAKANGKVIPGVFINVNTGHHVDMRSMPQKVGMDNPGAPAAGPAANDPLGLFSK